MASSGPAGQAVLVTECTGVFVVLLQGTFDHQRDLDLLDMALEAGHLTAKQVIIDLSRTKDLSARMLNTLLRQRHRAGSLPWLAGPLSAPVTRRLEITGTLKHFTVFATLREAAAHNRDQ
ncbi:hypothetical protein AB0Q95_45415 [Streptomyces sp. NPDC059900]|uniref:hypothetical protein n=1 Tax=Streptomyces sp. NPDC059900 TaxID=3155816 RepID=UPI003441B787